ncbi:glycogen debranching protein GlgX [Roseospira marina]|uniref:Glycogen debranching protein GlgX n=1 Tax=Roseospira marina TaxID=140057 RepID=A0A5M6IFL6_9PROT|nr:glycogen debranching protein GlgX [Roseospira marina]KAA5607081.1 glycogen debranching protein GlgX [Roseospira marina]MBB4312726.1 glycogen operon protein [Roseospira marina]MBB5086501.1 glycogen operon protein [Roseospira marina]
MARSRRARIGAVSAGRPDPLGATVDRAGVGFAVAAPDATRVEICLFDTADGPEMQRIALPERDPRGIWHGHVAGLRDGQLYGLRVHGPYDPARGHRFNPHKLLVDPWAREVVGRVSADDATFGFVRGAPGQDLTLDTRDSAPFMPKAVVRRAAKPPSPGPGTAWADTILYEAHVKGLTMLHPDIPPEDRGTFRGVAHPAILNHLVDLGITALELLPVFAFSDERHLPPLGLSNYWGYNPYAFLAPDPRYGTPDDMRTMVAALHDVGIEVILDVVYNHTAESDEQGQTLSLRGLGNRTFYRTCEGGRHYVNDSGCGNSLRLEDPLCLRLVMDSLRHWVTEMGVDGFRFDLAPTPARHNGAFDVAGPFLAAIGQDPTLRAVKLIAEPWDLGDSGHQTGAFPAPWAEWNDHFRDAVRHFFAGQGDAGALAAALSGSSHTFAPSRRPPQASINFVTAHDGFTLRDLVTYDHKHNEANAENNRDGTERNLSWNEGVEGETDDPAILAGRDARRTGLMTALMGALGVPMLLAGDELGHTQGGNNNAYCQDNALSWIDWTRVDDAFLAVVKERIAWRKATPAVRRTAFFTGALDPATGRRDVTWLDGAGRPRLEGFDWAHDRDVLGMALGEAAVDAPPLVFRAPRRAS